MSTHVCWHRLTSVVRHLLKTTFTDMSLCWYFLFPLNNVLIPLIQNNTWLLIDGRDKLHCYTICKHMDVVRHTLNSDTRKSDCSRSVPLDTGACHPPPNCPCNIAREFKTATITPPPTTASSSSQTTTMLSTLFLSKNDHKSIDISRITSSLSSLSSSSSS